jgi:hypothetical protein
MSEEVAMSRKFDSIVSENPWGTAGVRELLLGAAAGLAAVEEAALSPVAEGADDTEATAAPAGSEKAGVALLALNPSRAFCNSLSKYGSGTDLIAGKQLIFSKRRKHRNDNFETTASLLSDANKHNRITKLARICTSALGKV